MKHRLYQSKKTFLFAMLILLVMAAFNLFYQLGNFPIYSWDEARHGVSAFEMIKNNNFIVNTYRYKADYWNLKPPLSFWTIILGYKLAGFNALGLRLCSAAFAMLTIMMVAFFVYKRHGKLASILSTLVLLTCTQYITNHGARTGDADSLFVFLFTIAILSLLIWEENHKWLYASGLAFSLAFLTKSWHAGNIAIIIGLYLFLTGKYKRLSIKNWALLCMCMILPIVAWGVIRYQYDGLKFFQGMIMYDLLHRSTTTIEGHVGGIFYYFGILLRFFKYWLYILCLVVLLCIFNQKGSLIHAVKKDEMIGVCLWVLVPFIMFTIAKTKVRWYIMPIYPPLSIIIGAISSQFLLKGKWFTKVILFISLFSISVYYESEIYSYLTKPAPNLKQSLIEKIATEEGTKGDRLYIYQSSGNGSWLQSDVLTAELSDNLHVENGGFSQFLKNRKALLMVPKKLYSQKLITANRLKVIASNRWGYLVDKKS
jgi:4-amino-4-deoxy-L-arabinose transferase-like glycosyltransferase